MTNLLEIKCIPCHGGVPKLSREETERLHPQIREWNIVADHHLEREWKFKDFKSALKFVNAIGAVAEEEGHHPDICFTWGKVNVQIHTHAVDGLTESDFVLAAKIDALKE
jgi:4a-hydroxytetrahydrobiopterin dehydratase